MAKLSKNVLAVLLLVTILVSIMGTISALNVLTNQGFREVPKLQEAKDGASGKVSVYVLPPPITATGQVSVYVK